MKPCVKTSIDNLVEIGRLTSEATASLLGVLEVMHNEKQELPPLAISKAEFERIVPELDAPNSDIILTDDLLRQIALELVSNAHLAILGAKALYQLSGNESKARDIEQEGFRLAGFCAIERKGRGE